jgi:hypothetical protein
MVTGQKRSRRLPYRVRLPLLGLVGLLIALVVIANLTTRAVDIALAPWHEVDGTIEVRIATQPAAVWTGPAVCSRSFENGPITEAHAPTIGMLPQGRVWIVLQLDVSDGLILALGQSALEAPLFEPTTEYGGVISGSTVQESPDRAQGSATFHVPLAKGGPIPLRGAESFLTGQLTWTCQGVR